MDKRNLELIKPVFSKIIKQGIDEGTFNTSHPDDAAETIMLLGNQIKEVLSQLMIKLPEHPENLQIIERKLVVFGHSLERILGAPEDSLGIPDRDFMNKFLMEDDRS